MRLQHLRLVSPITYEYSLRLQEALLERHFVRQSALRKNGSLKSSASPEPPTLITFQSHPTYTVGRRHLNTNPLSPTQILYLTGGRPLQSSETATVRHEQSQQATFYPSPRGGLLTYHAPGQLTAYLILNLRIHRLTPRCYIRMLEDTVIRTCARHGVANVVTTDDPGVWIGEKKEQNTAQEMVQHQDRSTCTADHRNALRDLEPTNRKICAIGVHVSRGITSHGIGFNIYDAPITSEETELQSYTLPKNSIYASNTGRTGEESAHEPPAPHSMNSLDQPEDGSIVAPGYLSWGFSRIVACGLEGKSVTWLTKEQQSDNSSNSSPAYLCKVSDTLATEVARSLKIEDDAIDRISARDILPDEANQKWQFLRSRSGGITDTRARGNVAEQYRVRDLRKDTMLRIM